MRAAKAYPIQKTGSFHTASPTIMKATNHLFKAATILLAVLALISSVQAQSVWSAASGNWSTPGNWLPAAVPAATTNVLFTNNVGAAASAGTVDNIVDLAFTGTIG